MTTAAAYLAYVLSHNYGFCPAEDNYGLGQVCPHAPDYPKDTKDGDATCQQCWLEYAAKIEAR